MIKIDIVSGFLGAGKTTFIKKLLKYFSQQGERLVLIENEFGEIGIDGDLVKKNGLEVYEITKGCICCSLKNDFISTLKEIIENIKPDRILFEPSGIFIPDEILDMLKMPEFSSKCSVNKLITIVDSVNFPKQRYRHSYFFQKQISTASVLVLSKTQLASQETLEEIINDLRHMNSKAEIIRENWDQLDDISISLILEDVLRQEGPEPVCEGEHKSCKCHRHHKHIRHDGHDFETYGNYTDKVFTIEGLKDTLTKLSRAEAGEIVRGKGFVRSDTGILEFSYVNDQFTISQSDALSPAKVCFIGTHLDREKLAVLFC